MRSGRPGPIPRQYQGAVEGLGILRLRLGIQLDAAHDILNLETCNVPEVTVLHAHIDMYSRGHVYLHLLNTRPYVRRSVAARGACASSAGSSGSWLRLLVGSGGIWLP